ncbi:MAG TPA: hypothetical protein VFM18_10670 [Methanosarcina sp.]|nr:hypothetical protein [Methanosarcina sp.]
MKTYPILIPIGGYHRIREMTAEQAGYTESELDRIVEEKSGRLRVVPILSEQQIILFSSFGTEKFSYKNVSQTFKGK